MYAMYAGHLIVSVVMVLKYRKIWRADKLALTLERKIQLWWRKAFDHWWWVHAF